MHARMPAEVNAPITTARFMGGIVLCLFLLIGCGGGPKGASVHGYPAPASVYSGEEGEKPAPAGLSNKNLAELYVSSGLDYLDVGREGGVRQGGQQSRSDLTDQINRQVRASLIFYARERQGFTRNSLNRANRYLPMIKRTFREYGLPEDLAYLAMIESGFNPQSCSPAHAVGMWQFIRDTGRRYGLVINNCVDERLDPEKSTRAAARYLKDLYQIFGSWDLAIASYNCGEGRIQRELGKGVHKNFWDLSANRRIPEETRKYVPQLMAATIIARNPSQFGFDNLPDPSPVHLAKSRPPPLPAGGLSQNKATAAGNLAPKRNKTVYQASLFGAPGSTSGKVLPAQAKAAHKIPGKAKSKNQVHKSAKKRLKPSPALFAKN
jgi:soluble lytic murein transglycosylase-like protein